jgi:dTDP-4-dehydrorhamnose reductase
VRVLVTGAGGGVGIEVIHELERRAERAVRGKPLEVIAATHEALDVSNRDAVLATIVTIEPDVVIHPAAFTAVDRCETEPDRAFAVNSLGTRHVAEACAMVDAHLAYVSTDYVFDGTKKDPYDEWDTPNPLSVYGRSKLGGERALGPRSTVVRTSWVCGFHGQNMVKTVLRLLASGTSQLRFVNDQHGCPTIAADLAIALVNLALERRPGVFHVTNQGPTTWFDFVAEIVRLAGGDPGIVEPISTAELDPPRPAPRPANSVLDNAALRLSGLELLRSWQEATEELVGQLVSAGVGT